MEGHLVNTLEQEVKPALKSQSLDKQSSFDQSSVDHTLRLLMISKSISDIRSCSRQTQPGSQQVVVRSGILEQFQRQILNICRSLQVDYRINESLLAQQDPVNISSISEKNQSAVYDALKKEYSESSSIEIEIRKNGSEQEGEREKGAEEVEKEETKPEYCSKQDYDQLYKKYKKYKELYFKEHQKSEKYKKELRDILQRFR